MSYLHTCFHNLRASLKKEITNCVDFTQKKLNIARKILECNNRGNGISVGVRRNSKKSNQGGVDYSVLKSNC